jgi:hypothetical protein
MSCLNVDDRKIKKRPALQSEDDAALSQKKKDWRIMAIEPTPRTTALDKVRFQAGVTVPRSLFISILYIVSQGTWVPDHTCFIELPSFLSPVLLAIDNRLCVVSGSAS